LFFLCQENNSVSVENGTPPFLADLRIFFSKHSIDTDAHMHRLGKTKYLVYTARDQPNPSGTPSFPFSIRPNDYCLSTKGGSRTKQFHSTTPLTICQLDTKQRLSSERRKGRKEEKKC